MKQSKDQRDVLARVGTTLIEIQRTELIINATIKHVLPTALPLSKIMLDSDRRPPLGQLIEEFKRHRPVSESFAATLADYLSCRNQFVHKLEYLPGWTLLNPEGIRVANKFLDEVVALNSDVTVAFDALHRSLAVANGATPRKRGDRLRKKSDKFYLELVALIFPEPGTVPESDSR